MEILKSFIENICKDSNLKASLLEGYSVIFENDNYKETYNNLGELIANTPEELDKFWNWFGDSMVVDSKGRPIVATHSTDINFDKFDVNKANEGSVWGKGIYLSLDKEWSGKKYIKRYYVKCDSLLYINKPESNESLSKLSKYIGRDVDYVPLISLEKRGGSVVNGAKEAGFDGIIHDGPGDTGVHLVVPDNNQLWLINTKSNINESISNSPIIAYHGTNDLFDKFDSDKTMDSLFWFSTNKDKIINGESGAVGVKYIMTCKLNIKNPAGWEEYDKYNIDQLISMGYDSVKLDDDYIVFNPDDIKIVNVEKVNKSINEKY